jgi:hypothetical protein
VAANVFRYSSVMTERPRVTRLVMYKHGVAYLERSGPADGDFDLSFRRSDMNDVLKSLAIGVARGAATIGAVAFETPSDPDAMLAERNLLLTPGRTLTELLTAVRGRTVQISAEGRTHRGEVIGIDETAGGTAGSRRLLVLRTDGGSISLVDLADARGLELVEEPSRDDLDYLIDRSRAANAGENRTVRVQVTGAAEDLRVSYVVPAPVWRVSYRLICDDASVTLFAMAIVHNPVDEDLDDVELTLTTGQPVSFDIDLYHGKWVDRKVVEEMDRSGSAPTTYEPGVGSAYAVPSPAMMRGGGLAPESSAEMLAADSYGDDFADVGDRGEHFEYRVSAPISLKRGAASMVPLVVARLEDARRERIWRDGSNSAPDIVLAFGNSAGMVLEEGPAVVYDDGSYAGEAMVPYTARGADLRLAFAKDLALRCGRTTVTDTLTTRVRLGRDALIEEVRYGDSAVSVIFELNRRPRYELHSADDSAQPFEQTATHHRFEVDVPAHGSAELTIRESRRMQQRTDYQSLTPDRLQRWLSQRLLDDATFRELSGVLAHWEEAQRLEDDRERLDEERTEAFEAQTRIAEQLEVLRDTGPEGDVRQRTVEQLVALQDLAAGLDAEIRANRDAVDAERRAATAELRAVIGEAG